MSENNAVHVRPEVLAAAAAAAQAAVTTAMKQPMVAGPCPTVRVVDDRAPGGFVVINQSDLTEDHVVWEEPKVAKRKIEADEARRASTEPKRAVHRGSGEWYVMRGDFDVSGPHKKKEAERLASAAED
jgi:hypothetical protein